MPKKEVTTTRDLKSLLPFGKALVVGMEWLKLLQVIWLLPWEHSWLSENGIEGSQEQGLDWIRPDFCGTRPYHFSKHNFLHAIQHRPNYLDHHKHCPWSVAHLGTTERAEQMDFVFLIKEACYTSHATSLLNHRNIKSRIWSHSNLPIIEKPTKSEYEANDTTASTSLRHPIDNPNEKSL